MISCDMDLPPCQPLAWILFLQKNVYFAKLHTETHYFAEISVCKMFYYRKVYFFKRQSIEELVCYAKELIGASLVARVDM